MTTALAALVIGWSFVTSSVATFAFLRTGRRPRPSPDAIPGASTILLRPCAGDEAGLADALRSSDSVPDGVAIRFLVASVDDEAASVAAGIAAELQARGRDARAVVTGASAPNKKADQLARALAHEDRRHDIVVVVDSDVRLTASSFGQLTLAITRLGCDAAWAPPIETSSDSLAGRMSAAVLDSSLHAFPLLAGIDPRGMVGKAMAVRRDALDAAGGFGQSLDRLGEDMHLAERLGNTGHIVTSVREPVLSLARHRSVKDVVHRYARWIAVIRGQRPGLLPSYPLLFGAAPLQLVIAGYAAVVTPSHLGFVAIAAVVVARLQTGILARIRSGRPLGQRLATMWLADVALLSAFVVALTTRVVRWRGSWLRLDQGRVFEVER